MEIDKFISEIRKKGFIVDVSKKITREWITIFDPNDTLVYKFPLDKNITGIIK